MRRNTINMDAQWQQNQSQMMVVGQKMGAKKSIGKMSTDELKQNNKLGAFSSSDPNSNEEKGEQKKE